MVQAGVEVQANLHFHPVLHQANQNVIVKVDHPQFQGDQAHQVFLIVDVLQGKISNFFQYTVLFEVL